MKGLTLKTCLSQEVCTLNSAGAFGGYHTSSKHQHQTVGHSHIVHMLVEYLRRC